MSPKSLRLAHWSSRDGGVSCVLFNCKSANLLVCAGVFAAPFINEEVANKFIRLKRQAGYWDPRHSQNMWGFTIQEQAQYYMDMSHLMFDRSVADENTRQLMEMLRNAQAHLDSQTGRQTDNRRNFMMWTH